MDFQALDKVTDTYLMLSPGIKQGEATSFLLEKAHFGQTCFKQCFSRALVGYPQQGMLETRTCVQVAYCWQ